MNYELILFSRALVQQIVPPQKKLQQSDIAFNLIVILPYVIFDMFHFDIFDFLYVVLLSCSVVFKIFIVKVTENSICVPLMRSRFLIKERKKSVINKFILLVHIIIWIDQTSKTQIVKKRTNSSDSKSS